MKKSAKRIVILVLPAGGYLVTTEESGDWQFCSRNLEEAFEYIRGEMTGPAPEVLTYAEAQRRIVEPAK